METLIIIVAFWFILIGIYGILPLLRAPGLKSSAAPKFVQTPLTAHIEREIVAPRPTTGEPTPVRVPAFRPVFTNIEEAPIAQPPIERPRTERPRTERPRTARPRTNPLSMFQADPNAGDPYAEVSMLRAQVEHLRSELVARSAPVEREDKSSSRARRYKVGAYAELPRPLRRQVREVRNERRPVRITRAS